MVSGVEDAPYAAPSALGPGGRMPSFFMRL
jgi:hypothetical protein